MLKFTLRQLRYFEAVARHGHFGRAAEACAVSQPAMSMQIKELEEALDLTLLERDARSVRLTGVGADVLDQVQPILRAAEALSQFAASARGRSAGVLRVGVIPTIAPYLLPALLAAVADTPLDLRLREAVTEKLLSGITEGTLDVAIVALPVGVRGLCERALFDEDFVLVRPHADAGAPVPAPETLPERALLLLEEGHCFRDQALAFCNTRSAGGAMEAASLTTLVQMVAAGLGVTLIPKMAVPVEAASAPVSIASFEGFAPARTVGLAFRQTTPLTAEIDRLSRAILRVSGHDGAAPAHRAPPV
ncbi:MAG: LysR substrate-binding domain-containing protein [Pseudomonadota bacterium]